MPSFIPHAKGPYQDFLVNMRDNIETEGPKFGLAAPAIASVKAKVTNQIARHAATVDAESALESARTDEADGQTEANYFLGEQVADWKRMTGWTEAIAEKLQVTTSGGESGELGPVAFKLKIVGGEVRVDWTKGRLTGVNIYARLRGQTAWVKIGMDTSSPYLDSRPLAVPGTAEVREYILRGVLRDEEVTPDSAIQSIPFAG